MYKLYYYPSNANLAPHIVLEEIGATYALMLVDRTKDAHKSPEYLKLNPSGRIPVLLDDDFALFESAAICLHLADRHPEANLAPALGTRARADFYKWLMYLTNTFQAELLTYFYPDRLHDDDAAAAVIKQSAEQRVGGMLAILDAEFAKSGGPWLLEAHYTVADPFLFMLARWTRGMAKPARSYAQLGPFLERMAARPAVQRALAQEGLKAPFY